MDYMIAAVSGDVDKAQALEDIRYDCKARAVLVCSSFLFDFKNLPLSG